MKKCNVCNKKFNKATNVKFCSRECYLSVANIDRIGKTTKKFNICVNCNKENYNPKFCSRSCSVTFNNKILKLKNKSNPNLKPKAIRQKLLKNKCELCNKLTNNKKYCSHTCSTNYIKSQKLHIVINDNIPYGNLNGSYKRRILEYKNHTCEKCGLKEWLDGKIPLSIHHIDGNGYNNKLANLQVLCLNCHGQTENYGSKNKNSVRTYRKKYN